MRYKISEVTLNINEKVNNCNWNKFITNNEYECQIQLIIKNKSFAKYDVFAFDRLYTLDNDLLLVDKLWNNAIIILESLKKESLYSFLLQIFYAKAIYKQIIQFHSSLIKYNQKGVMFLGPSGIGKTTQAELWNKHLKASIINGDMVFVECKGEEFIGWGTPWHGSSPYCENVKVPVVALIVLKQGKVNKLRKLNSFEMVSEVGKNILYPTWVDNGTEMSLDVLDHLLQRVSVYELTNKADEESVLLVKQEIFCDD